ncbi:MOSC domain-containing protein [Nocardioides pocheonensis]|uniref:MOSC domain-containing protein n=1 Tax=Nocardioides pocheonensis TaxID=661485 RepID=A0A3N0GK31_9ACTN|nr:MOSC domain-containing protein [Nocardioides pocheonensis]
MEVSALAIHPVKSTAIRHLERAEVRPWGLAGDRRWMVVDDGGTLVTAREVHELFSITADTPETEPEAGTALRLSADGHEPIDVVEPDTAPIPVRLHRHDLVARPAEETASAWVRKVLGRDDLTLVWCDDPERRSLNPAYGRPGDHTAFADGYPVTLTSLDSLARLNEWMVEDALQRGEEPEPPLPIERFRANVVVRGAEPFAEDDWHRLRIGAVAFRKAKLIDRCVMTTISLVDLTTAKEPIRTLARHRQWDHNTWFGIQLIPETTGPIEVGDPVVLE